MTTIILIVLIIVSFIINAVYIQSPFFIVLTLPAIVKVILHKFYGRQLSKGTPDLSERDKTFLDKNQSKISIINIISWLFSLGLIFGSWFYIYHSTYPNFYSIFPQLLMGTDWAVIKTVLLLLIMLFYWSFAFVYLVQIIFFRENASLLLKYDLFKRKQIKVFNFNFFDERLALIMFMITILIFLI